MLSEQDDNTSLLKVNNLRFGYTQDLLFDNFSMSIDEGAIVALIGPNGAGKSTLMHCICGIIRPFAGDTRIAGTSISANPVAARKHIGYLPDNFGLYDRLSVRQHLQYIARVNQITDIDDAVTKMATEANLLPLMDKPAEEMSRGQRQRLGIGMAIIHRPRLLLLDEPASGLDPLARVELAKLLTALKISGTTILVSSHILTELREYATDYLILQNGRTTGGGKLNASCTWRARINNTQTDNALAILQQHAEVSNLRSEKDTLFFQLPTADSAPELLKNLVLAEILVVEFTPVTADIEDLYKAQILKS